MSVPSLPAEVVRRILELIEGVSRPTLLSCSLVSRSFASEAQGVLWREVTLRRKDSAKLFVDSPATQRWHAAGIRKVHTLYMFASNSDKQRINTACATSVLDVCRGIKEFKLFSVKGHNASLLYHPSLSELRTLNIYLDPDWSVKKLSQIPAQAPYSLTTASLSSYSYKPGIEVIRPLFLASQNSLTRLEIFINTSTAPIWTQLLPLVAARITMLRIMVESSLPPEVLPVLSTFGWLHTFRFHNFGTTYAPHLQTILSVLSSFKVLQLEANRAMTAEVILEALNQPATAGIEKLQMVGGTRHGHKATPESVLDECARRSITHELIDGLEWL